MPEELLHEREYTRTGIAPAGSSIALADMDADEGADAAKTGSDAELGKAGAQNRHFNGQTNGHAVRSPATHFVRFLPCRPPCFLSLRNHVLLKAVCASSSDFRMWMLSA